MTSATPPGVTGWFIPIAILLLFSGCTSKSLLTSLDYEESLYHHSRGDAEEALKSFPRKEQGNFITTLEKAYLKLLQGESDTKSLRKLADKIEKRMRFQGSREVKSLFYAETAEGYYASEHEIIWLHFLLSWGYSLEGKFEEGCVEARKASHLLTAPWSHEGHFDDPLLRIILGGLWAMCGSWDDAVIDFRKAQTLAPGHTWLQTLSEMEDPPRNLFIVLGGVGPYPNWNPGVETNLMRGFRHVSFDFYGEQSDLSLLEENGELIHLYRSPGSAFWYQRHFERDNAIHELIVDSHYTTKAAGIVTLESAKTAVGYTAGLVVIVGSIALGAGIAYVGIVHIGGELGWRVAVLGAGVGAGGSKWGIGIMRRTMDDSIETAKSEMDASKGYRYVRFLPEYAWVGWSEEPDIPIAGVKISGESDSFKYKSVSKQNNMMIGYYPDVDIDSTELAGLRPVELRWRDWKAEAFRYLDNEAQFVSWKSLAEEISGVLNRTKTRRIGFSYDYLGSDLRINLSRTAIEGQIERGIFHRNPVFSLKLNKRTIEADPEAKQTLVESRPAHFLSTLLNRIVEEKEQFKR